jgi:hypothetical protein
VQDGLGDTGPIFGHPLRFCFNPKPVEHFSFVLGIFPRSSPVLFGHKRNLKAR